MWYNSSLLLFSHFFVDGKRFNCGQLECYFMAGISIAWDCKMFLLQISIYEHFPIKMIEDWNLSPSWPWRWVDYLCGTNYEVSLNFNVILLTTHIIIFIPPVNCYILNEGVTWFQRDWMKTCRSCWHVRYSSGAQDTTVHHSNDDWFKIDENSSFNMIAIQVPLLATKHLNFIDEDDKGWLLERVRRGMGDQRVWPPILCTFDNTPCLAWHVRWRRGGTLWYIHYISSSSAL